MIISGKTRVYGVIGDPIEHSLSPVMHNAAFEALGLDCLFLAFKVKPAEVGNAVNGMRAFSIHGLNVTMPHKTAVIPHLDEIDKNAQIPKRRKYNPKQKRQTSRLQHRRSRRPKSSAENGVEPKGKKVLLLGAGGASRAIAFTLAHEADELVILNRTVKPAKELVKQIKQVLPKKISADELSPKLLKTTL